MALWRRHIARFENLPLEQKYHLYYPLPACLQTYLFFQLPQKLPEVLLDIDKQVIFTTTAKTSCRACGGSTRCLTIGTAGQGINCFKISWKFPGSKLSKCGHGSPGPAFIVRGGENLCEMFVCSRSAAKIEYLEIAVLSSFSTFASEMSSKITNNRKYQEIAYIASYVFLYPQKFLEVYNKYNNKHMNKPICSYKR